ncbi:hypothetical protein [Janthinobacterium sp. TND4EL3]|uniref:hypothetical protein n=1 Tax=Janthinobacterium sp. TND4EL3 TaxID=1907311 RepID=UPI0011158532|nr:hypothetical protein [Janthinobacterium sp. TND4EL3]
MSVVAKVKEPEREEADRKCQSVATEIGGVNLLRRTINCKKFYYIPCACVAVLPCLPALDCRAAIICPSPPLAHGACAVRLFKATMVAGEIFDAFRHDLRYSNREVKKCCQDGG